MRKIRVGTRGEVPTIIDMPTTQDYARIESAIQFLLDARDERPSLEATAAHVGLSPFHFQRLFQRFAGTTPNRFLQFLRAEKALARLRDAQTVLDTAFDVGLSGPGRLHDLMINVCAATPGEVRSGGQGLQISYGTEHTPWGPARMGVTNRGIASLVFLSAASPREAEPEAPEELVSLWPAATLVEDRPTTRPWFARAFAADARTPLALHLRGTNLQLRVWAALLQIPGGTVTSYGALAKALGKPRGARAIANAVAANPIAYVIPCHRVLRASGAIGGYRWGVSRKYALLGCELAHDAPAMPE